MKKIGLEIDYSNICKDYNTAYLDRDNKDPATSKCMREVLQWSQNFFSALQEAFGFELYNLSSKAASSVEDIASKRFLFYSLEKEITLQSYIMIKGSLDYNTSAAWQEESRNSVLIKNDEDGGCLYLYFNEASDMKGWITEKLKGFSLDEIPFEA